MTEEKSLVLETDWRDPRRERASEDEAPRKVLEARDDAITGRRLLDFYLEEFSANTQS